MNISRILLRNIALVGIIVLLSTGTLFSATNIYIDFSGSMRGYIHHTDTQTSEYSCFIKSLLDIYSGNYFKVGGSINQTDANFVSKMANQNSSCLPSYGETNLVAVLQEAGLEAEDINILVTDGVLSTKTMPGMRAGFDLPAFTKALQTVIENKAYIYLLGINSEFHGRVYYGARNNSYNHEGRRPFVVLMWGTNKATLEKHVVKILNTYKEYMSSFDLAGERRVLQLNPIEPPKIVIKRPPRILGPGQGQMFFLYTQARGSTIYYSNRSPADDPTEPFSAEFGIGLKYSTKYPQDYFKIIPSIQAGNYLKASFSGNKVKFNFNHQFYTTFERADDPVKIKVNFKAKLDSDKINKLWNDWSTLNDANPKHGGKILNLSRLIRAVIKASARHTNLNTASLGSFSVVLSE